jgi:hypothetical protein
LRAGYQRGPQRDNTFGVVIAIFNIDIRLVFLLVFVDEIVIDYNRLA